MTAPVLVVGVDPQGRVTPHGRGAVEFPSLEDARRAVPCLEAGGAFIGPEPWRQGLRFDSLVAVNQFLK